MNLRSFNSFQALSFMAAVGCDAVAAQDVKDVLEDNCYDVHGQLAAKTLLEGCHNKNGKFVVSPAGDFKEPVSIEINRMTIKLPPAKESGGNAADRN